MSYTLEEKINILGLDRDRISFLQTDYVEEFTEELLYENLSDAYEMIINTNDLVGTTRPIYGETSWIHCLEELHKDKNFCLFDINTYDTILIPNDLTEQYLGGLPHVIKKNERYYIYSNGKHRLTIAKCLGNKNVKVIVTDYIE